MTHDELLTQIETPILHPNVKRALRAVVELHKPVINALPVETCYACQDLYPCPTIEKIEAELI